MEITILFETGLSCAFEKKLKQLLDSGVRLYCFVKDTSYEKYKAVYVNVYFINMEDPSYKESTAFQRIAEENIGKVYILSSTPYFYNMERHLALVIDLNYKFLILCDCYGCERKLKKFSSFYAKIYHIFVELVLAFWRTVYRFESGGLKRVR